MNRKYYTSSTIAGVIVGLLIYLIWKAIFFITDRLPWQMQTAVLMENSIFIAMITWAPPLFVLAFSYVLSKKYLHIWRETKTRLYCVFFAIIGYIIGNFVIFSMAFFLKFSGSFYEFLQKTVGMIGDLTLGSPLAVLFTIYASMLTNLVLSIGSAYYVTDGIENTKKRVLIGSILVYLMCLAGIAVIFG
jgi:hypothetical protein